MVTLLECLTTQNNIVAISESMLASMLTNHHPLYIDKIIQLAAVFSHYTHPPLFKKKERIAQ